MKNYWIILFCFILQGCVGVSQAELNRVMTEVGRIQSLEANEIRLARGERSFEAPKDIVTKAFVTTFGQFNMAVVNLDQDVGYILGEGSGPIPPEEFERVGQERVAWFNEMTQGGNPWTYVGDNTIVRATINLFDKGDNLTTAKLSFSSKVVGQHASVSHSIGSLLLDPYYTYFWDEFDKQLFILQTIDN
jgi:hypothetical protein